MPSDRTGQASATPARRKRTTVAAPEASDAGADPRQTSVEGEPLHGEPKPPRGRRAPRRAPAKRGDSEATIVAGVRITHPERVLYPEVGVTKLDIAEYYVRMASHILPHVRNRPLSLVRCPQGPAATCFFQKHATERDIPGISFVMITERGGEKPYVNANNAQALAGLAQMGTLELHAWNATGDDVERADMMVFDFDPDTDLPFGLVAHAALQCRAALAAFRLESYAKTTGGKGLHVVVPFSRRVPWDSVKRFAKGIAEHLAAQDPERYTIKAAKGLRKGRIFIDYLRNARGATAVVPYSVRAREGATVSVPLYWNEVNESLDPRAFTVRTIDARLAPGGDPWAGYRTHRQTLTVEMQRQLERAA